MYVVKFSLNRFASSIQVTHDSVVAPNFVKIIPDQEQHSSSWGRGGLVDIDEHYVAIADHPFTITIQQKIIACQGNGWEQKITAKEGVKMKYVLTCDCGSNDFTYNEEDGFKCKECDNIYTNEDAGKHLLGDFEY